MSPIANLSPAANLLILIIVIGMVIGGIAAITVRGRGLVIYLICGVAGAFVGILLVPRLGVHFLDPFISAVIDGTIGAIIFVVAARIIFRLR